MAPSAATAASRQRTSSWPRGDVGQRGDGRARPAVRPGTRPRPPRPEGRDRPGRRSAAPYKRRARARTAHRERGIGGPAPHRAPARCARAWATSATVRAPRRASAPSAAACTSGSASPSPRRARSASPACPAAMTRRRRGRRRGLRRGFRGRIIGHRIRVWPTSTRIHAGEADGHPPTIAARPRRDAPRAPALARRPRRRRRADRGDGGGPQPLERQLLRHHPGRRHAGGALHHGPADLDHPLTGQHPPHRRLRTPLNALTYLQERYFSSDSQVISGGRAPRARRPRRTSSSPRATWR